MADAAPGRLTQLEIETLTGIEGKHPIAQRNQLRRWGIKAEVNARSEVVCFRAWIELSALPVAAAARYLPEPSANDEDDDIGMDLGALDGKS